MPLFDFKCSKCGFVQEKLLPSARHAEFEFVDCPHCMISMHRQVSAPAFKVNGQFTAATGYASAQVREIDHGNGIKTIVKGHFEQHDNIMQRKERIQSK